MINKLWIFFIVSGSIFLIINGKADVLNTQILSSGKTTLDLIIQIFPLLAIWLGIMNIANLCTKSLMLYLLRVEMHSSHEKVLTT